MSEAASGRSRTARTIGFCVTGAVCIGLTALAVDRIDWREVATAIVGSNVVWILITMGITAASATLRALAWGVILRAAAPFPIRRRDVVSAMMIGILMSATLPARLGELGRSVVLARRTGRMSESLPMIAGTCISQAILNIPALVILGVATLVSTGLVQLSVERLFAVNLLPLIAISAILLALLAVVKSHSPRLARWLAVVRDQVVRLREGLAVFRAPRSGVLAALTQLSSWGVQVLGCYALFAAMNLDTHVGIGGAAAVLFAVNVSAVIPLTPSNIGIFQLAAVSVLTTAFDISPSTALAYGVVLQAQGHVTAVLLGGSALFVEGVTWSEARTLTATAGLAGPERG
ncbi:lysylphosphatidylglycerol synthetase family protein [Nocardiopsis gilva YIM 90087]|uniref:Lysylphosphatidylglycerol synthetase family protein n=1 Tax=Nocardiopsis gilva YIM 90087 TaxID=1235441 RepID=A0A223S1J7_9ACTN|nr:lysylphosphatidylglycerol synthase transmembrane domain-containing protein [Nocardiopsis gilva]ASU82005.1 lysylphosphatidylglycerol synthetase family protein [Nocardiopsis gilva YIM 90087]